MHLGLTVEIGDWHRFSGRNPVRWSIDRSHRRTTGCGVCASSVPAQQSNVRVLRAAVGVFLRFAGRRKGVVSGPTQAKRA